MDSFSILLIEKSISVTAGVVSALGEQLKTYNLSIVKSCDEAISEARPADVILLNINQLPEPPLESLAALPAVYPNVLIFLLINPADSIDDNLITDALNAGAADFVSVSPAGLLSLGRRLADLQRRVQQPESPLYPVNNLLFEAITGDASQLAIQVIGGDNRIKIWNRAAEDIFGVEQKKAINCPIDQLPLPSAEIDRLKDVADQSRASGRPFFIPQYTQEKRPADAGQLLAHVFPVGNTTVQEKKQATSVCIITAGVPAPKRAKTQQLKSELDLRTLLAANREISGQLELKTILQKVSEQAQLLLNIDNCQICFLEKDNKTLRPVQATGPLSKQLRARAVTIDDPFIAKVVVSGKAVVANAADVQPGTPFAKNEQLLFAPLTAAKGVIGLVGVSRRNYSFSPDDLRFFESLVQQASAAINNARLFEETQRSLIELEILYSASTAISAYWDDDQGVLNTLIQQIVGAVNVSLGFIASWNKEQNTGFVQAVFFNRGEEQLSPIQPNTLLNLSQRATMLTMVNQQRPIVFHLSTPSLDINERAEMEATGAQSRLIMPLVTKGDTIGWIELWETQKERVFTADQVRLCRMLASQMAIALQNSHYREQTQQTLEEATALYRVSSALTTLQDRQTIMSTVLQEYLHALGLHQGSVVLLDFGAKQGIVKIRIYDNAPRKPAPISTALENKKARPYKLSEGQEIPLTGNPVYEKLMRNRQAVVIDNPQATWLTKAPIFAPNLKIPPAGGWGDEEAFSIVAIPIKIREEIVGVLVTENTRNAQPFSPWVVSMGQAMADQLGIGLQNVALYEAEFKRREQAETLREVSSIVSSSLDLSEVLEFILDQLNRVIKYDSAAIHLIEDKQRRVIAARGFAQPKKHIGLTFPIKASENEPGSHVIHSHQPAVYSNISEVYSSFKQEIHSHIKSWMGIPLIARDKVIGLISIDNAEINAYGEEDVQMALAFANQVAIALENARLYEIEVRELERELEIAQQIQETLLPQTTPQISGLGIAGRIIPARQVGGDFYHFFSSGPGHVGIAIGDVSGKGIPAALYMAAGITAIDTQAGPDILPGELLNRLNKKLYNRLHENKMNIALQIAIFMPFGAPLPDNGIQTFATAGASLMTVASAGMIAPVGATSHGCRLLPVGALPVGAIPAPPQFYTDDVFFIEPSSAIIFTSDGIVEAQNEHGELFGFERLEQTILEIIGSNNADLIADYIINAVQKFTGEVEQHDDMTVVVVAKT